MRKWEVEVAVGHRIHALLELRRDMGCGVLQRQRFQRVLRDAKEEQLRAVLEDHRTRNGPWVVQRQVAHLRDDVTVERDESDAVP